MTNTLNATGEQLDQILIEHVKQSTLSTIGMITGEDPCYIDNGYTKVPFNGIIGIISLVGGISWSLMFNFPRTTAVTFTPKFAGFEIPYDSPDMSDVIGEFANVVAGDISARFDAVGVKADLSLPAVARGTDVDISHSSGVQSLILYFTSSDGDFWIEIASSSSPCTPSAGGGQCNH